MSQIFIFLPFEIIHFYKLSKKGILFKVRLTLKLMYKNSAATWLAVCYKQNIVDAV